MRREILDERMLEIVRYRYGIDKDDFSFDITAELVQVTAHLRVGTCSLSQEDRTSQQVRVRAAGEEDSLLPDWIQAIEYAEMRCPAVPQRRRYSAWLQSTLLKIHGLTDADFTQTATTTQLSVGRHTPTWDRTKEYDMAVTVTDSSGQTVRLHNWICAVAYAKQRNLMPQVGQYDDYAGGEVA